PDARLRARSRAPPAPQLGARDGLPRDHRGVAPLLPRAPQLARPPVVLRAHERRDAPRLPPGPRQRPAPAPDRARFRRAPRRARGARRAPRGRPRGRGRRARRRRARGGALRARARRSRADSPGGALIVTVAPWRRRGDTRSRAWRWARRRARRG